MARLAVGVDVGGTFTDLAAIDDDGRITATKVLSTPGDQSDGVEQALRATGAPPSDIGRVVHGTTVATNTLLERSGARVVLCATEGFTGVLELRRQERASLYDLAAHHPAPLTGDVVGVPERIEPQGVTRPLTEDAANAVAHAVAEREPQIVAVSLLHAYRDADHEHRLARALGTRLPGVDVVLSSEVLPEIREYERTATTVAEAYLRPGVTHYLRNLGARLDRGGYPAPGVMTSSGGMRRVADASRAAASLALSGPAGGVVGAALASRAAGVADALTIDIGGTSADVGLILDGAPLVEQGGDVAGVPIALPRVLVETVSAGGGSVGWRDEGGALRVGPRSAGARPGPAAFGLGGTEATVSDAHVLLGHIPEGPIAGGISIAADLARRAVQRLATELSETPERVARAMLDAADAAMARALRRVSVERGVDPRRCTLIAFGGGGPLHACALAGHLGMRRIFVPPHAGILSAVGLAASAERRESMASVMRRAPTLTVTATAALCDRLDAAAGRGGRLERMVRARYAGQGHEVEVPLERGDDGAALAQRFAALHRARFGFTLDREVELVSARCASVGEPVPVRFARGGAGTWSANAMRDDGSAFDATVRGRAVIALENATLLVAEGWIARALPTGGWHMERDP